MRPSTLRLLCPRCAPRIVEADRRRLTLGASLARWVGRTHGRLECAGMWMCENLLPLLFILFFLFLVVLCYRPLKELRVAPGRRWPQRSPAVFKVRILMYCAVRCALQHAPETRPCVRRCLSWCNARLSCGLRGEGGDVVWIVDWVREEAFVSVSLTLGNVNDRDQYLRFLPIFAVFLLFTCQVRAQQQQQKQQRLCPIRVDQRIDTDCYANGQICKMWPEQLPLSHSACPCAVTLTGVLTERTVPFIMNHNKPRQRSPGCCSQQHWVLVLFSAGQRSGLYLDLPPDPINRLIVTLALTWHSLCHLPLQQQQQLLQSFFSPFF